MKRALFVYAFLAVLFISLIALASTRYEYDGYTPSSFPRGQAQPFGEEPRQDNEPSSRLFEVVPDPDDVLEVNRPLADYARVAMEQWAAKPSKWCTKLGCARDSTELRSKLADDMSAVVSAEPAIFPGNPTKEKTIGQLATIALFESGFVYYVADGSCNDAEWRLAAWARQETFKKNVCDKGNAFTVFQLQNEGYVVYGAPGWGWTHLPEAVSKHGGDLGIYGHAVLGDEMLAHPRRAVRVALHRLRTALPSLCGYSGEAGPCPKAALRVAFARDYATKHPTMLP